MQRWLLPELWVLINVAEEPDEGLSRQQSSLQLPFQEGTALLWRIPGQLRGARGNPSRWQHWTPNHHSIPASKGCRGRRGREAGNLPLQKHRLTLVTSDYGRQTVARSEKLLKILYNRHLQLIASLDFPNVGCVPFRQAHSVSPLLLRSVNHRHWLRETGDAWELFLFRIRNKAGAYFPPVWQA